MSAVKERMADVIQSQPEDATYEEILRELAFEQMIASGLKDSREGKTISNDEMKRRLSAWQK
jgi:predicted transcriptional regulator